MGEKLNCIERIFQKAGRKYILGQNAQYDELKKETEFLKRNIEQLRSELNQEKAALNGAQLALAEAYEYMKARKEINPSLEENIRNNNFRLDRFDEMLEGLADRLNMQEVKMKKLGSTTEKGLALVLLALIVVRALHTLHALGAAEGGHHLTGQVLHIVVGEPHLLDHIVHGLDPQLPGAVETETLGFGLSVFNALDEDDGHVFMTSGTKCRLHSLAHSFICAADKACGEIPLLFDPKRTFSLALPKS